MQTPRNIFFIFAASVLSLLALLGSVEAISASLAVSEGATTPTITPTVEHPTWTRF